MTNPRSSTDTLTRPDKTSDSTIAPGAAGRRIWTLIVACLGVALVVGSMVALNTALSDIVVATSATQTELNWIVDGYTLALACLLLPAGTIGDRYGRRGALLVGLAIFSIASVAPVVFHGPVQIIAARALAGAGAAFVMPATLSLLTVAYPKDERTKAVGIWAGVAGSGGVLGMLGSGLLLHFWDWRSIFWALSVAGALVFALTFTVSRSRDRDAPAVDWPGAVLIGAAVAVFVFGILQAPTLGWTDPVIVGCLAAGLVIAVVFGFVEFRRRQPLLDVRLFASPDFATGVATITVVFIATFGFFYLGMQYVQQVLGYSPLVTALAFSPMVLPLGALSALSFWYLPRLGLRLVVFAGMLLMSAGFFCLRGIALDASYVDLCWRFLVLSVGLGLCTAPTTSAIMGAVPDEKQGVASAINDTTREVGGALGIAVAGSILAERYSHELVPRKCDLYTRGQSGMASRTRPLRGPWSTWSCAAATSVSGYGGATGMLSAPAPAAAVRSAAACCLACAEKSSLPSRRTVTLANSIGQNGSSTRSARLA
jgi:EmrB/QacA subfamily drug resistance transporter